MLYLMQESERLDKIEYIKYDCRDNRYEERNSKSDKFACNGDIFPLDKIAYKQRRRHIERYRESEENNDCKIPPFAGKIRRTEIPQTVFKKFGHEEQAKRHKECVIAVYLPEYLIIAKKKIEDIQHKDNNNEYLRKDCIIERINMTRYHQPGHNQHSTYQLKTVSIEEVIGR